MTVANEETVAAASQPSPPARPNPFSTIDGSAWGGSAISAAVGYGAGLVIAIVSIIATVMLAGWNLDGQWIFAAPVQLVAMSLFGPLSASAAMDAGFLSVAGSG